MRRLTVALIGMSIAAALVAGGCGAIALHRPAAVRKSGRRPSAGVAHVELPPVTPLPPALPIASQTNAAFIGAPATEYQLTHVAMASPAVGYASGTGLMAAEGSTVLHTTDGGAHFRALFYTPQSVVGVSAPDLQHVFILEDQFTATSSSTATLLRLSGGSGTPVTVWTASDTQVGAMSFPSAEDGFIAASDGSSQFKGRLLVTQDGGVKWQALQDPCPFIGGIPSVAVAFTNASAGWLLCGGEPGAGMQGKTLYETSDGGKHWTTVAATGPNWTSGSLPIDGYVSSLAFMSPEVGYIGLDRYGMLRTTDGGKTWAPAYTDVVPTGSDQSFSVGFLPGGFGWLLAGEGPPLLTTGDAGATWRQVYPAPTPASGIALAGGNLIVGLNARWPTPQIVESPDGGATWSAGPPLPFNAGSLQAFSASDFAATGPTGIESTTDGGADWTALRLPAGWAAERIGYYQRDAGWIVAVKRDGQGDIFSCAATVCRPMHVQFTPLYAQATGPAAGIAVGEGPSGIEVLFRTQDGGLQWTGQTLPSGFSRGGGAPGTIGLGASGQVVWVYTQSALLLSSDGGTTWREILPPAADPLLAAAFTDARHGLLEAQSGASGTQFWRTADGGTQFQLVQ